MLHVDGSDLWVSEVQGGKQQSGDGSGQAPSGTGCKLLPWYPCHRQAQVA